MRLGGAFPCVPLRGRQRAGVDRGWAGPSLCAGLGPGEGMVGPLPDWSEEKSWPMRREADGGRWARGTGLPGEPASGTWLPPLQPALKRTTPVRLSRHVTEWLLGQSARTWTNSAPAESNRTPLAVTELSIRQQQSTPAVQVPADKGGPCRGPVFWEHRGFKVEISNRKVTKSW